MVRIFSEGSYRECG